MSADETELRNELPAEPAQGSDGGVAFWVGTLVGWGVIVIGVRMGLHDRELKPGLLVKWVAATLVVHDAVWLTLVAAIGTAAGIAFRRRRIPIVMAWAAATSAVLFVIGWPFLRGYGRRPDVRSALQRNYAHGLLVYIVLVWLIAIGAYVVAHRRRPVVSKGHGEP